MSYRLTLYKPYLSFHLKPTPKLTHLFVLIFLFFASMAASVDPLVVGRVIGDVVDMFVPSVGMSVYYGSKHVTNGCDVKPSMATSPPKLNITGHSDELYTLVLLLLSILYSLQLHSYICFSFIVYSFSLTITCMQGDIYNINLFAACAGDDWSWCSESKRAKHEGVGSLVRNFMQTE